MSSRSSVLPNKIKLKTFKSDLAPIGFFFDLIPNDYFEIPIMPIPMRIDKLSNGQPNFFILPDLSIENNKLNIDLKRFLSIGLQNLVVYSKKKYKEMTNRDLKETKIIKWFEGSTSLNTEIYSLKETFSYVISEFLKVAYKIITNDIQIEDNDYLSLILEYCTKMIKHSQDIIEDNIFFIKKDNSEENVKLYKEKKNTYHPEIIKIETFDFSINKHLKKYFVPYLIYDDLFECFSYNKQILIEHPERMLPMSLWIKNRIINKEPIIDNFDVKKLAPNTINLNDINIE